MSIRQWTLDKGILTVLLGCCVCAWCAAGEVLARDKGAEPNHPATRAQVQAQAVKAEGSGPLDITIRQAILLALENNRSLVVQRLNPQIEQTYVHEGLSVFDPVLTGELAYERDKVTNGSTVTKQDGVSAGIGVQEFLPSGTTLGLTGSTGPNPMSRADAEDEYASRLAFNATQSLLRGRGSAVNLASLRQAGIDVQISQYELRGYAQAILAQTEETYWDYVAAERGIEIGTQSLDLAQRQLEETKERIRLGDVAPTELSAAEAEVALRKEVLINARSTLAKTRLNLLRLVNPPGANPWTREVVLSSPPVSPSITLDDVESHVALAMDMRPDLNQARLLYQRDDLEVVKTKNGVLPKLDLFITLGKTGYADSFGGSIKDIGDDNYDAMIGLDVEYPLRNRSSRARQTRAVLSRQQAREAIDNLSQLVEVDVRAAYLEIARSQEQVAATAATRRLQEEKLRVETEKFRLGKSTALLVGQAQRDFVASRIGEVQAVVSYLKSLVEIYRQEGSLLERRGSPPPEASLSDCGVCPDERKNRTMMNRWNPGYRHIDLGRSLILALVGLLCLCGCSKRPEAGQGGRGGGPPPVPVTVATAGQKTTPVTVRNFGSVEAFSNVEVKAQVTGVLTEVHFTEGQKVKKGDLLFSIDPRQPQAALKMAQANLERDQAQLKNAEREAARQGELLKKGFISQDEYDQVTTAVETLRAAVSADQAAIENTTLQLGYCSIRSPVNGYTGKLYVQQGNLIRANDVSIVSIRQIDPIYASFWVPEQHLPAIQRERAAHDLDVAVTPSGDGSQTAHGVLSFVDNTVDPDNHMIHLRAILDNAEGRLWPGQYADVVLTLGEEPNSIVVPSQAIQTGQSGPFLYVVKADQKVEDRPITVGRVLNGETVVKGVQAGEVVVTDGQLRLVPGARVQVKESPKR